ncbi:MAG: sulfotransferase [Holosporaceae bacterium]|jgi:hypothetical protein|nr:sulfotransferase [Holosporaceae bacterium]
METSSVKFINIQSACCTGGSAVGDWVSGFEDIFYLALEFGTVPNYGCNFCDYLISNRYKLSNELMNILKQGVEKACFYCDSRQCANPTTQCNEPYTKKQTEMMKAGLLSVSENLLQKLHSLNSARSFSSKIIKRFSVLRRVAVRRMMKAFFIDFVHIFSNGQPFVTINFFSNNRQQLFTKYSQFFDDLRMIFITRDPRDTFTSWEKHGWISDEEVERFIAHYKNAHADYPYNDDRILGVRFEDFVLTHEETSQKILNFIGISKNSRIPNHRYKLEYSRKNIGKWKSYPNQNIMEKIATELKGHLYET